MAVIELVIDLDVDLIPVRVFFRSKLVADERISPADPAEVGDIQTVRR